jgi:hypothetical protein
VRGGIRGQRAEGSCGTGGERTDPRRQAPHATHAAVSLIDLGVAAAHVEHSSSRT